MPESLADFLRGACGILGNRLWAEGGVQYVVGIEIGRLGVHEAPTGMGVKCLPLPGQES